MNKTDKIIFGPIIGLFFPYLFALIAICIGFFLSNDKGMPYFFAAGLIAGIIADLFLFRRLLISLFDLNYWLLAGFYILCNIFIFGTFMGFPVCNLIMGLIAGYYIGRRIRAKNISSPGREILVNKVTLFSAFIMIMICISTAFIALREKTIGEELQGMLRLGFVPGKGLINSIIIIGGSGLIIIQYFITRIVIVRTLKGGTN